MDVDVDVEIHCEIRITLNRNEAEALEFCLKNFFSKLKAKDKTGHTGTGKRLQEQLTFRLNKELKGYGR